MWWCFRRSGHASREWDGRACNASAHASPIPTPSFSSFSNIIAIYIQPQDSPGAGMNSLLYFWHFSPNEPSAKVADNPPRGRRDRRGKAQNFGVSPYVVRFPNLPFSGPIFQWGITAAHRTLYVVGCPWMSLGAVGCRWVPLDVVGCRWVPLDVVAVGCCWMPLPLEVVGCRWMLFDVVGCCWMSLDIVRCR